MSTPLGSPHAKPRYSLAWLLVPVAVFLSALLAAASMALLSAPPTEPAPAEADAVEPAFIHALHA